MGEQLNNTPDIEVVDLFCGIGGLSYGMKCKGFKIKAGYDLDNSCKYAYEANTEAIFKSPNRYQRLSIIAFAICASIRYGIIDYPMQRYGKAANISLAEVLLLQSVLRTFVRQENKTDHLKH